jgi:hypothetical protein
MAAIMPLEVVPGVRPELQEGMVATAATLGVAVAESASEVPVGMSGRTGTASPGSEDGAEAADESVADDAAMHASVVIGSLLDAARVVRNVPVTLVVPTGLKGTMLVSTSLGGEAELGTALRVCRAEGPFRLKWRPECRMALGSEVLKHLAESCPSPTRTSEFLRFFLGGRRAGL